MLRKNVNNWSENTAQYITRKYVNATNGKEPCRFQIFLIEVINTTPYHSEANQLKNLNPNLIEVDRHC